jgi:hypothetical protein
MNLFLLGRSLTSLLVLVLSKALSTSVASGIVVEGAGDFNREMVSWFVEAAAIVARGSGRPSVQERALRRETTSKVNPGLRPGAFVCPGDDW